MKSCPGFGRFFFLNEMLGFIVVHNVLPILQAFRFEAPNDAEEDKRQDPRSRKRMQKVGRSAYIAPLSRGTERSLLQRVVDVPDVMEALAASVKSLHMCAIHDPFTFIFWSYTSVRHSPFHLGFSHLMSGYWCVSRIPFISSEVVRLIHLSRFRRVPQRTSSMQ